MTALPLRLAVVPAIAAVMIATTCAAAAQGGLLDSIFGNSDRYSTPPSQPPQSTPQTAPKSQTQSAPVAQGAGELTTRIDRLEAQVRQLTGIIEQLQHRNQQLETQLKGLGVPPTQGAAAPPPPRAQAPAAAPPPPTPAPPSNRRSDVFDPAKAPNAPGAPKVLGTLPSGGTTQSIPDFDPDDQGGRGAGAPLDLSTMAGAPTAAQPKAPVEQPVPQPPRPPAAGGGQVATLPPSDSPRDHFDLAYGFIKRKDFALAEDGFRNFLKRFPGDRLVPDAQFWLAETLFQRQNWRDAAELFLGVSTKYETHARAPDALLRLGQALAQMGEREAACASLGEVQRKYPRAGIAVKQSVEREQKRIRC